MREIRAQSYRWGDEAFGGHDRDPAPGRVVFLAPATPGITYRGLMAGHLARQWESVVVGRFAARVNALGPLAQPTPALQDRLLAEVKTVARALDVSTEAGMTSGYDRRVLYEDPTGWSLAAIILRPGQQTHPHNHDGWGCAVTVQGIERDRRFVHDEMGKLVQSGERDYPPGRGYIFDPVDVHQPFGADPHRVTVALHFLAP